MTLPTSGPMLASMINAEIGRAGNAYFDINGTLERQLAGVPTGQVTFWDFYGKSRGLLTPQADYTDPNTITETVTWSDGSTQTASLIFETDGTLAVQGTLGAAMPAEWYQFVPPPAGYTLFVSLVSVTITGDTDDIDVQYNSGGVWAPLGVGFDYGPWATISTPIVPLATVQIVAVYDVSISDGTAVVITFRLTLDLSVTP